jgi:hypothetical protein
MKTLLLTAAVCLLFLTLSETMPVEIGYGMTAAALLWFSFLLRQNIVQKQALKKRRSALQARWAIVIRHLNGLPLPVDTPATLFYTGDSVILETEQEKWAIDRKDVHKLLLTTSEQVRRLNDRQLCRLLQINDRIFYALRDKIRHHDSGIRRASILILTFRSQQDEQTLWVMVSASRPQTIANLLQASGLRDISIVHLQKKTAKQARKSK